MSLCHKRGVDCFHVLTLVEESLEVVHAVSQSVLPGSLRLLGHRSLDTQVVNLCQGEIVNVIGGNCDTLRGQSTISDDWFFLIWRESCYDVDLVFV